MTLFALAVRSHRTGAIVMAMMGGLAGALNSIGFIQIAGTTAAERQAFAHQMEILGRQLSYLLPAPVQLDTMGGYMTWRDLSTVALTYTIWAVLAGTGAARGDEERGLTETWLAAAVSKLRWLATRVAGFIVAATLSITVAMAATWLGTAIAGEPLPALGMVEVAVVTLAIALVGFGIGLAVAQFVLTRRTAASLGAVIVIALHLLNSVGRSGGDAGPLGLVSPFALFDRSTPLLREPKFDGASVLWLLAIAAALTLFAFAAFGRRDLGGSIVTLGRRQGGATFRPSADPLLRLPVYAQVDQQRWWIAGWAAGLGLLAYFMTSLAHTMIDSLRSIPTMRIYLERQGIAAYSDFVGVIWFGTLLLLVSALVIVQANGWAADDADGRLETILAAGASRTRVVLERIAALLVAVAIVSAASAIVVGLAARSFDIAVPSERLALSAALVVPLAFAVAAIGHLLVGWRPRVAVLVLGIATVLSYFVQQFAPIFDAPSWVAKLSFFTLYGTPMTSDDRSGIWILMAIGAAGTVAAVAAMQRRDVGV